MPQSSTGMAYEERVRACYLGGNFPRDFAHQELLYLENCLFP